MYGGVQEVKSQTNSVFSSSSAASSSASASSNANEQFYRNSVSSMQRKSFPEKLWESFKSILVHFLLLFDKFVDRFREKPVYSDRAHIDAFLDGFGQNPSVRWSNAASQFNEVPGKLRESFLNLRYFLTSLLYKENEEFLKIFREYERIKLLPHDKTYDALIKFNEDFTEDQRKRFEAFGREIWKEIELLNPKNIFNSLDKRIELLIDSINNERKENLSLQYLKDEPFFRDRVRREVFIPFIDETLRLIDVKFKSVHEFGNTYKDLFLSAEADQLVRDFLPFIDAYDTMRNDCDRFEILVASRRGSIEENRQSVDELGSPIVGEPDQESQSDRGPPVLVKDGKSARKQAEQSLLISAQGEESWVNIENDVEVEDDVDDSLALVQKTETSSSPSLESRLTAQTNSSIESSSATASSSSSKTSDLNLLD